MAPSATSAKVGPIAPGYRRREPTPAAVRAYRKCRESRTSDDSLRFRKGTA